MKIAFEQRALDFQEVSEPLFAEQKVRLTVARLDKLHADISGNKLFKLHYFLEEAHLSPEKKIITFGGAYSNHLAATAFAAKELGLRAVGIVRGDEAASNSHTLERCKAMGMELNFISRIAYRNIRDPDFMAGLKNKYGKGLIIPEGGFHPLGAKGAALIMEKLAPCGPSHVCVPVGTATTLAGLIAGALHENIVGIPVLKHLTDIPDRIRELNGIVNPESFSILDNYHFGGYARTSPILTGFMNYFFDSYKIPLDFVYTAKMMYGVIDQIKKGHFPEGSQIICLHTGGLQGNKSLKSYDLTY